MKTYRIIFYIHLALLLSYSIYIIRDLFSTTMFLLAVLNLIGLVSLNKKLIFSLFTICTIDFVLKIINPNIMDFSNTISDDTQQKLWYSYNYLNPQLVQNIAKGIIQFPQFLYSLIHISLWFTIYNYFTQIPWKWGPLVHQISYYSTPCLIFILSYLVQNHYIKVSFLIAYIVLLIFNDKKKIGLYFTRIIIVLIFLFQYAKQSVQMYQHDQKQTIHINDQQSFQSKILLLIQFSLLMSFQTHQTPSLYDIETMNLRGSQNRRYTIKKRQISQQNVTFYTVLAQYVLTFLVAILTTGLGNIVIAIGVFKNLPDHNGALFRKHVYIGIIISILFQPRIETLIYAIYLLIIRDIQPYNYHFQKHSNRIIVQLSRLYILLNHVSVVNFLLGIFRKPFMALAAICFKILCRYYQAVSILMGTNQSYGIGNFFSFGSLDDTFLWIYLVLLLMYSPFATPTFSGSNILNIFEQYNFLRSQRFEIILHVLKVFHWLAYSLITLIILDSYPSLFVLVRAIILFIIIGTDIVGSSQRKQKNRILSILWNINLYVTLVIALIKYFYMLKLYLTELEKYSSIQFEQSLNVDMMSPWLYQMLTFLSKNATLLGLQQLTMSASEINIWIMFFMFFSDILVIIISMIMIFIIEVKIYEDYRNIIIVDQNRQQEMGDHHNLSTQLKMTMQRSEVQAINQNQRQRQRQRQRQNNSQQKQLKIKDNISLNQLSPIQKKQLEGQNNQNIILQKSRKQNQLSFKIKYKKYAIHYLYTKYIKPIHLNFNVNSVKIAISSTFLMEYIYLFISTVYFLFQASSFINFILYFPLFTIYGFYFYKTNYFVDSFEVKNANTQGDNDNSSSQDNSSQIKANAQLKNQTAQPFSRSKIYFPQKQPQIQDQISSTIKYKSTIGNRDEQSMIQSQIDIDQQQQEQNVSKLEFHKLRMRVLMLMVCYACLMILLVYAKYVWKYVFINTSPGNNYQSAKSQYKLYEVITKFSILIVILMAYQFQTACPYDQSSKNNKSLLIPSKDALNQFKLVYKEITFHIINVFELALFGLWIHCFFNGKLFSLFTKIVLIGFWVLKQLKKRRAFNQKKNQFQRMQWITILILSTILDQCFYDKMTIWIIILGRFYCYTYQTYYYYYHKTKSSNFQKILQLQEIKQQDQNENQEQDNQNNIIDNNQQNIINKKQQIDIKQKMKPFPMLSKKYKLKKNEWQYLKSYRTLIYISPLLVQVITILSTTYLKYSITSTILNIIEFLTLLLLIFVFLLPKFKLSLKQYIIKIILIISLTYGVVFYIGLLFYGYYLWYVTDQQVYKKLQESILPNGNGISLFIFSHLLLLYIFTNQKLKIRAIEARKYWEIKSQILVQIGAQLHNQKKLVALQNYYKQRQQLQDKVSKLMSEIQKNKQFLKDTYSFVSHQRKNMIQSLSVGNLLNQQRINDKYQLFSNMLILMECQVLTLCFQKLNLYDRYQKFAVTIVVLNQDDSYQQIERFSRVSTIYAPQREGIQRFNDKQLKKAHQVILRAKQIRNDILRNYSRSIGQALKKWQIENIQQERSSMLIDQQLNKQLKKKQQQSNSFQINFDETLYANPKQKLQESYNQCYKLIHIKSMQYPFIVRKIVQNSEMICLMIITGWNFFGGPYTMPINIIIFAWAIVLQSKTTITFWLSLLFYASFISTSKIILGIDIEFIQIIKQTDTVKFLFLKNKDSCTYQFIVILVCTIQIILIHLSGTSFKAFSERQSIYDSFYRMHLNRYCVAEQLSKKNEIKQDSNKKSLGQQEFIELYKSLSSPKKHHFFHRVFSKSRFKPGKDFYPLTASIQLLILLFIFFFYDQMQYQSKTNQRSFGQILKVDNFSANMVIAMFIQIIIIIIDRFIVSLNLIDEKTKNLQNFFMEATFRHYDYLFGKYQIEDETAKKLYKNQLKNKPPDSSNYGVGFYDFLLILKYLFHVFLLFFINFLVYLYIPSSGFKKSIIPNHCRFNQKSKSKFEQVCQDNSYFYLSTFFFLYILYFLASGLQIKHGFNRNKCKNTLMQSYHWMSYYMYLCFTGLPFLWEFKKICDWTVTSTSLPLFHWMKFEDVNARLYQSKCESQMLQNKPSGIVWYKYILGPLGFISILALVFSPVMIYSQINPFAIKDQILGSAFRIDLIEDGKTQYKFFSTSYVKSIGHANKSSSIFANETDSKRDQILMKNQMYRIDMTPYPDQNFLLSQPAIKKLSERLKLLYPNKTSLHFYSLRLNVAIIQKQGGQRILKWANKDLTSQQVNQISQLLQNQKSSITIQKYFSPFPGLISQRNLIISTPNNCQYFQVRLFNLKTNAIQNIFYFYATTTKFQIGFGVVTFYLTYVLLVSRLLRFYLTGYTQNIIYEGVHMQKIAVLCDAVRSARILQDFYTEQYFYFQLIDLMRAPKQLKTISGDFQYLIQKKQNKLKFKNN